MQNLNQSYCFSFFSGRLPGQAFSRTHKTEEYLDAPCYELFPSQHPEIILDRADQHRESIFQAVRKSMDEIFEDLQIFNQELAPQHQICRNEIERILLSFFYAVFSSRLGDESLFFDKKIMSTKHSAVYFKGKQGFPCLFIKPNVKNNFDNEYRFINTSVLSSGGEKIIKKSGFLIIFSKDFSSCLSSHRYASFSKSFQKGKDSIFKDYHNEDCLRNGFFPISFVDGCAKVRHIFLIPYLGETIDKKWDLLTARQKLHCAKSIIEQARDQKKHDIKIMNTLVQFFGSDRLPDVSLIDGYSENMVYTFTPYSPQEKNRKGCYAPRKRSQKFEEIREIIPDLKNLLGYIDIVWKEFNTNQLSRSKYESYCRKFISSLKHKKEILQIFLSLNHDIDPINKIRDLINRYEIDFKRYEYLKSSPSEQEITGARIFSLAIMFWQLINSHRVKVHSVNSVFSYDSAKLLPQEMYEQKRVWCLQHDQTTESPLTDIVLKGYEGKLSFKELEKALSHQIQIDEIDFL